MSTTTESTPSAHAEAGDCGRSSPAKGSGIERARDAARAWCKQNPGWESICDMGSTDHLYFGWDDLTKSQKLSWRYRHGEEAKAINSGQTAGSQPTTGSVTNK